MVHDPIANCILIAALFDSVADYIDAITAQHATGENLDKPSKIVGSGNVSSSILREVLSASSLSTVAMQNHVDFGRLKRWVAAYPGLSERRATSACRKRLSNHKNVILAMLATEPGLTRAQVAAVLRAAVAAVERYDNKWLEQNLPAQKTLDGSVAPDRFKTRDAQDEELCEQLSEAVKRAKAGRARPVQLVLSNLIQMSGLNEMPADLRAEFPITIAMANHLGESPVDYYRRCLQWAAQNLVIQNGACDNLTELFVHARVSLQYVKPLEKFARSLLDCEHNNELSVAMVL